MSPLSHEPTPRWRKRLYVAIAASPACVFLALAKFYVLDAWLFERRFESLSGGMTERQVIALLGAPDRQGSEFELWGRDGYEEAYARAASSGATSYLTWSSGVDRLHVAGFSADGALVLRESGSS